MYLKNGYNLIRIAAGDEGEITFCPKQELFKYTVMRFRLTNSPAYIQAILDTIFKDMEGCIWCLDNIFIYVSHSEVEYHAIVDKVLQQCVKQRLTVHLIGSEFYVRDTIFLVQVIDGQEVKRNPCKLETMYKWPMRTKKTKFNSS